VPNAALPLLPELPTDDRAYLATLTVLYAEDEPTVRELLAVFLSGRVGQLLCARDGQEALELFGQVRPAIVVTDIQMPRLDGLGLIEAIRRTAGPVPVVLMTAFEQVSYLQRAIELGVDKYITKPPDPLLLEELLLKCARRLRAEALLELQRRKQLEAALARSAEATALLAGGMAHDFNNLLQTILANLEFATPNLPPGSSVREDLEAALSAAREARLLGRTLLSLSMGGYSPQREGSVEPPLREALKRALRGRPVELELSLPEPLPLVRLDPEELARAFEALARNAAEAMGAGGGRLSVAARVEPLGTGAVDKLPAGAYLAVSFRDSGPGVSEAALPKIFDPYFSTKRLGAVRGTGLGLSVARAVAKKHGGHLDCTAPGPGGTVFTLWLPLAAGGA
jgi:signal transduction histidine kinase